MKELKVIIVKNFHDPDFSENIFFIPNGDFYDHCFLENRNLITVKFPMPIQRYHLDLKLILNLKEFKIEVF